MQEIIIEIMEKFGYIGIMLLIAIENIFPPIPSEVILTFGGFATIGTSMEPLLVILFATIGALIGAIALYFIGKILNKERLFKIADSKVGKILRLKRKDIEMADGWFEKRGSAAVFFGRCIPIVRSLISIPAGMSEMAFGKFLLLTTLGTVIWNTVLVYLGVFMGDKWETIVEIIDKYSKVVLVLLIIVFIGAVIWFYRSRMKKDKKKNK